MSLTLVIGDQRLEISRKVRKSESSEEAAT
jgi:hypothetical protein